MGGRMNTGATSTLRTDAMLVTCQMSISTTFVDDKKNTSDVGEPSRRHESESGSDVLWSRGRKPPRAELQSTAPNHWLSACQPVWQAPDKAWPGKHHGRRVDCRGGVDCRG